MNSILLSNLRLPDSPDTISELAIINGRFATKEEAESAKLETLDLGGMLVLPGLIETHIHLDKACIMNRCNISEGTLEEAIEQTANAKDDFTEDDVYERGKKVIERAITFGTMYMRTQVEIDPDIGLTGFYGIRRLQKDYAWAVDIEICVFPQEGLLDVPGTEELLCEALESGATVLGGCPYSDDDPEAQIRRLFELAERYNCDLDMHLDFDLDPEGLTVPEVIRCTLAHGWQNRVTIGHVTKLAALSPSRLNELAAQLADAGVRITSLPSTELFLNGRDADCMVPRGVAPLWQLHQHGVTCSVSSNNIDNPFTPYGDASLIRMANLYANVAQLGSQEQLLQCLYWVSLSSAKLLRLDNYGLQPGCRADFIVIDADTPQQVVSGIHQPLKGFRAGRQTFERPAPRLLHSSN